MPEKKKGIKKNVFGGSPVAIRKISSKANKSTKIKSLAKPNEGSVFMAKEKSNKSVFNRADESLGRMMSNTGIPRTKVKVR